MISALLAVDSRGGMGYKGTLPWYVPEDLQKFKDLTMNNVVVMGRKTWDDKKMPKPLVNRNCYVVTSRPDTLGDHALPINGTNLEKSILDLEFKHQDKKIYVIGGPKIIMQVHNILDQIHITQIQGQFKTDVRINVDNLVTRDFIPRSSSSGPDQKATFIRYEKLFKRH